MDFIFDPSLVLYLPLHSLDGASFQSKDAYGHLCTRTGAIWTPRGHSFDGSDDLIDCGSGASLNVTTAFTVLLWVKFDTITPPGGDYNILLADTDLKQIYFMYYKTNKATGLYINNTSQNRAGNTELAVDTWYCLDGGYDGGNLVLDLGLNGEDDTGALTGEIPGSLPAMGGTKRLGYFNANELLDGFIGEVWLFNRHLSRLERQNLYLATKWRYR